MRIFHLTLWAGCFFFAWLGFASAIICLFAGSRDLDAGAIFVGKALKFFGLGALTLLLLASWL